MFQQFQQTGPRHNRNGQNEGEVRCRRPGHTDHQCPQNRGAGPGGSRENSGDQLEHTDEERLPVGDIIHGQGSRRRLPVMIFDEQESDTHQNQHHGYTDPVIEMGVDPVIQGQTDYRCRNARHNRFCPQPEHLPVQNPHGSLLRIMLAAPAPVQRPDVMPVQQHHGQNRPQLNHHQEHIPEFLLHIHCHELVQQDHVAGAAHRKPLGDSLHDAEQDRFHNVDDHRFPHNLRICPGPGRVRLRTDPATGSVFYHTIRHLTRGFPHDTSLPVCVPNTRSMSRMIPPSSFLRAAISRITAMVREWVSPSL